MLIKYKNYTCQIYKWTNVIYIHFYKNFSIFYFNNIKHIYIFRVRRIEISN